jgi:hypothetical protein
LGDADEDEQDAGNDDEEGIEVRGHWFEPDPVELVADLGVARRCRSNTASEMPPFGRSYSQSSSAARKVTVSRRSVRTPGRTVRLAWRGESAK